jgi:hypothetical protein
MACAPASHPALPGAHQRCRYIVYALRLILNDPIQKYNTSVNIEKDLSCSVAYLERWTRSEILRCTQDERMTFAKPWFWLDNGGPPSYHELQC